MSSQEILDAIPHRDPFLLVDEIIERSDARIVGAKTFSGREWFFAGHYPDFPLVPGVLLCEAAMQCGAIFLSRLLAEERGKRREESEKVASGEWRVASESAESRNPEIPKSPNPSSLATNHSPLATSPSPQHPAPSPSAAIPVVTRMNDVRFKRMVRPGERIVMEVELVERLADAFFLKAKVSVEGKVAVRFEFACTAAERL